MVTVRSARVVGVAALAAGMLLATTMAVSHRPILVWNATASAPIGLYLGETEQAPTKGDLVLVRPPPEVAAFASRRDYLPLNIPLIKRIVGTTGDTVCARGDAILLNGRVLLKRLDSDRRGRILPRWSGCKRLDSSEVFLAMTGVSDSFDGRYFGPIPATNIIGRLLPLWTR